MTARAVGCCVITGFAAACMAAGWLAGKLAERREARASAADAARILRAVEREAAEVAMLNRWYAADSAKERS